ncbi:hypothetical protein [Spiroplasma sp. SV19]|uniref:hypothetical protein n=1 Tax=Spiroplasma sp. SV19 TaxID=2570468 RepID=UPI0024B77ECC|nr:hypothetical protein [Spiroplasma sp. SV19]WHQ36405.1 hypothetical protein E7Y35_00400 [Spiroplasma sp. SV19]
MGKDLKEMKQWLNNMELFINIELDKALDNNCKSVLKTTFSSIESEEFSDLSEKMFQKSIKLPHVREIIERLSQD